ncbi:MAG: WD40/YVTN/BNR-like repeat-containing protein [Chloroflexota bacterium]
MFNESLGWGIAGNALYRTRDGGATWQEQVTPRPVGSLCFADPRRGWVASSSATPTAIFTTSTGGQTWAPVQSPPSTTAPRGIPGGGWPQELRCASPNVLWDVVTFGGDAGGEGYVVARSPDGGRHWAEIASNQVNPKVPQGPGHVAGDLTVVDASTAYLIGWCGSCGGYGATEVGRTLDAGKTWQNFPVFGHPIDAEANAVSFPTVRAGWLVASWHVAPNQTRSALLRTTNDGETWQHDDPTVLP